MKGNCECCILCCNATLTKQSIYMQHGWIIYVKIQLPYNMTSWIDSDAKKEISNSEANFDNFQVLKISDSAELQLSNAPSNFDSVCISIIEDELEARAYDIFLEIKSWGLNGKYTHVQKALDICFDYERIRVIIFFLESRAGK